MKLVIINLIRHFQLFCFFLSQSSITQCESRTLLASSCDVPSHLLRQRDVKWKNCDRNSVWFVVHDVVASTPFVVAFVGCPQQAFAYAGTTYVCVWLDASFESPREPRQVLSWEQFGPSCSTCCWSYVRETPISGSILKHGYHDPSQSFWVHP